MSLPGLETCCDPLRGSKRLGKVVEMQSERKVKGHKVEHDLYVGNDLRAEETGDTQHERPSLH